MVKSAHPRDYVIMYFLAILLAIRAISAQECFDDGNEFCINQDDILSIDLLPGTFLFTDQNGNTSDANKPLTNESVDGSFDRALNEMDYHR